MQISKVLLFNAVSATLALSLISPARAQQEAIERCRLAESDQERIACLEAALRGSPPADEMPGRPDEPSKPPSVVSSAPPVQAPPEQTVAPPVQELGAEQVAARASTKRTAEPPPRLTASIANSELVHYQRLQVTLENNQVWRQIRGDNQRIQASSVRGQSVEIWESNLGGYRMRLNEMARTIRVERIR